MGQKVADSYLYRCPHCRNQFNPSNPQRTGHWRCRFCYGEMVSLTMLRKLANGPFIESLLEKAAIASNRKRDCLYCSRPMKLSVLTRGKDSLSFDLCEPCQSIWFDTGQMTKALWKNKIPKNEKLPLTEGERVELGVSVGEDPEMFMESVLNMVNIESDSDDKHVPYATYGLVVALLLLNVWISKNYEWVSQHWGFLSSAPFRHFGLTWVSSVFIHAGLAHLVGNLIFLFLFGGMLELACGSAFMLEIFFVASLGDKLMYALFPPKEATLVVGASGAILGIMTFFCLQYPKSRITLPSLFSMTREIHYFTRMRLRAIDFLGIYVIFNLVGFFMQRFLMPDVMRLSPRDPASDIGMKMYLAACFTMPECQYAFLAIAKLFSWANETSFLSHLGGCIGGFAMWLHQKTPTQSSPKS